MKWPAQRKVLNVYRVVRQMNLVLRLALLMVVFAFPAVGQEAGSFQQVDTKTLDKEKFVFPDDMRGRRVNIVLLAIGTEQESATT